MNIGKMNPIRAALFGRIKRLVADWKANPVQNHMSLVMARELNNEFMSRSRGKGRN